MRPLHLPAKIYDAMATDCAEAFPHEACGFIFGVSDRPETWAVETVENIQNQMQARDPQRFGRDATTAYYMDPLKVSRLIDRYDAKGHDVVGIYHSHPGHPAYFSRRDKAAAMPFGQPTFPRAWQVVLSVFDGAVCEVKAFLWQASTETWQDAAVGGLPPLSGAPAGAKRKDDI